MNKFKQYRQAKTEYAYSLFKNERSFEKVRAFIIKDNKILLVHRIKSNVYSLPGGGVENDENYQMAVERECYEEAKAKVKFKSVVGILNYDVNMTYNSEKFLSTRIEYYCLCEFLGFIKKKKFFGLNGEFFEKVEVVWKSLDQIEQCGLSEYIVDKLKKVQKRLQFNQEKQDISKKTKVIGVKGKKVKTTLPRKKQDKNNLTTPKQTKNKLDKIVPNNKQKQGVK